GVGVGNVWTKADQLPNPHQLQDSTVYQVRSRSFDLASNTQTAITVNSFTVDQTSPTAVPVFPLSGGLYNAVPVIRGMAQDNNLPSGYNVDFPMVRIQDVRQGYWNGT